MASLEEDTLTPDFWQDQKRAQIVTQKMSRIKALLDRYNGWKNNASDLAVLLEVALEVDDESVATEIEGLCNRLNKELEKFEFCKVARSVALNVGFGNSKSRFRATGLIRLPGPDGS